MNSQLVDNISNTVLNNFVDSDKYSAVGGLSASLVANESKNTNVYRVLKNELQTCSEFTFAVAFITDSGLSPFLSVFQDLAKKGVKGRILTSTYLWFNQPKTFEKLANIPNVEVRIYTGKDKTTAEALPFHAKGYMFSYDSGYNSAIIGSSNLTNNAIIKNYEWNLRVTSLDNAEITKNISEQIEAEWARGVELTETWIEEYTELYKQNHPKMVSTAEIAERMEAYQDSNQIVPNKMQKAALDQLAELRQSGKQKGLIISATGTGKTYLGAFDVRSFSPKRFLFVAHREQILQKSLESFYKVIGGNRADYGIYSGNNRAGLDKKYVFATVQTLSKPENLALFSKDAFDYILFDEAHHLGASMHQRIFEYFTPKFCLGMTATPERTDNFNVYKLFNYDIAYEIRLQDALEENMLCPFYYYGVEDYELDGEVIDDTTDLKRLVSKERVDYIVKQTKYYGYSGDKLHGLIFCSRKEEAKELAVLMSQKGYKSVALTGEDSIARRDEVVAQLENGEIDYIVTVDIFNEGIDIPCVNQVVMLRNTESSIVFVQQLGRGLRKFKDKEYVTIIDFIGNYKNNYLIPIALTGDKSHSKDSARDAIDLEPIYGTSVINFTKVAKERIYKSISQSNLTLKKKLHDEYMNVKNKLGRVPLMCDLQRDSIDQSVIASKYKQYNAFLLAMDEEEFVLTKFQEQLLSFVTVELSNGLRKHELLLLNALLNGELTDEQYVQILKEAGCYVNEAVLESVDRVLSLAFFDDKSKPNKVSYGDTEIIQHDAGLYRFNERIKAELKANDFKALFEDAIRTGLLKAEQYDPSKQFTIGSRYERKDVCRLLNFKKRIPGQNIGGYFIDKDHDTCPIFITYHKSENISETIQYGDYFKNPSVMHMYSKNKRRIEGAEIQSLYRGVDEGKPALAMDMFVKKSDDEGTAFIYLGSCEIIKGSLKQEFSKRKDGKEDPIVSMDLRLANPVDADRYYMLTEK